MILKEISRGISHIEDLSASELVRVLSTLSNFQITEKVDGAQILFGIDAHGFYTSRETKGGQRVYNEADYGVTFSSTYMRSAHTVLEQMLPQLRIAGMRTGDQVEAEVLYGELPNVVPYSADSSHIIFLRTTEGNVNIGKLKKQLTGKSESVSLTAPFTPDGKIIELREETTLWKFAQVPSINISVPSEIIKSHISHMSTFLSTVDAETGQQFGTILETPLNKIPTWASSGDWKSLKEYLKTTRENIQTKFTEECVLPVKDILLDHLVRKASSAFGPSLEDGGWIEGVVLKEKLTGKMVKLVDKSVFGAVRERAWLKRNMITEHAKSVTAPSSFMGRLLVDMATSLGHPELGTIHAKHYLRKSGTITEERLSTLSKGTEFTSVQSYWDSLLELREEELIADLDKYKTEVVFSKAIHERTLQTYAETFRKIKLLKESTQSAVSIEDLIIALIGKQLGEI